VEKVMQTLKSDPIAGAKNHNIPYRRDKMIASSVWLHPCIATRSLTSPLHSLPARLSGCLTQAKLERTHAHSAQQRDGLCKGAAMSNDASTAKENHKSA